MSSGPNFSFLFSFFAATAIATEPNICTQKSNLFIYRAYESIIISMKNGGSKENSSKKFFQVNYPLKRFGLLEMSYFY